VNEFEFEYRGVRYKVSIPPPDSRVFIRLPNGTIVEPHWQLEFEGEVILPPPIEWVVPIHLTDIPPGRAIYDAQEIEPA
jgi:hypothetical protein